MRKVGLPLGLVLLALFGVLFWKVLGWVAPEHAQRDVRADLEFAREFDGEFAITPRTIEDGADLAAAYCAVCHLAPPAEALPVASWKELLPMKYTALFDREGWHEAGRHLAISDELAQRNALTKAQFATIVYSYLRLAPTESVPQIDKPAMSMTDAPFKVIARIGREKPEKSYTAVTWDPHEEVILAGDANALALDRYSPHGVRLGAIPVGGAVTGILPRPDGIIVTAIGESLLSFDNPDGAIIFLPRITPIPPSLMLDGLRRPIRVEYADFNGDGVEEALVPEFGFTLGSLSLYDPAANNRKRVLIDNSGTVAARVADVNGDGKQGIVALVSQNLESLYVLTNDGYAGFNTEVVFQGHPSFGSNALAIGDLNGDGLVDLVTAVGDSFDLMTRPLKNYHGIRVFSRKAGGGFDQSFFYPMYGAIDVKIGDYDGDGDRDIVAVAFFPDWSAKEPETAVYLENVGNNRFVPHQLPGAQRGRWIAIASEDINGDGLDDIVLAAAYSPMFNKDWDARFGEGAGDVLLILQAEAAASRPQDAK